MSNGTSYIAFKTKNGLYDAILASPNRLPNKDWLFALFNVDVGSIVQFKALKENNAWILTELNKG